MSKENFITRFKDAPWLHQQEIIVGGAGGIGSPLIVQLAKMNHKIFVYDMDKYEDVNVGPQLIGPDKIGQSKATAIAAIANQFSGYNNVVGIHQKYTKSTGALPIAIAAFDNMQARKDMLEAWWEYICKNDLLGKKPCVYIDPAMFAEQGFIRIVQNQEQMKKWLDEYKPSSEMPDGVCTFRATAHNSFILSGYIVAILNSVIANFYKKDDKDYFQRYVPYKLRYELENLTFNVIS